MFPYLQRLKAFAVMFVVVATGLVAEAQYAVTTANLNMRLRPSIHGKKMGTLPEGTRIEIVDREGSWTLIQTSSGRRYYVANKYLKGVSQGTVTAICTTCLSSQNPTPEGSDGMQDVIDYLNDQKEPSSFSACISEKLVEAAKDRAQNVYGGRRKGKGRCAYAVRKALNKAGIWQGGGIGNAKDMLPGLKRMGYINVITRNMTPDNAPKNSILVYGTPLRGARGCSGLGNRYGHVEIKESNDSYLYDGNPRHNIQEAFGAKCRPLLGVMMMGSSCPTCTASVKRTCGA